MSNVAAELVSKANLFQWIAASETSPPSDTTVDFAPDLSGNNNAVSCASSYPTFVRNLYAGQPTFRWASATNPLKNTTVSVTAKHFFIVAKFGGTTFTDLNGLMSDNSTAAILDGASAGATKFFDLSYTQSYYKNKRLFANSDMQAPMNSLAVVELIVPGGLALTGIQVGRDRALTARTWVGDVAEWMVYTAVKPDCDRTRIYEYLSRKYWLWTQNTDSYDFFPFVFDRATEHTETESAEISAAEGGRGRDKVVRYLNDAPIQSWNLQFSNRSFDELATKREFLRQHRLHIPFYIHDIERQIDRLVVWKGETNDVGRIAGRFDYSFQVVDF